jgi:hypothetical protein
MLGYVHYFAGLISYTAAGQFPDLGKRPLTLYGGEVSLLLSTPISTLSAAAVFSFERILVGGGFLGSFLIIWVGSPRQRRLALGICLVEICLLAIGVSNCVLGYWFGPAISYFEMQLFPYFALCLPSLLLVTLIVVWRYAAYWVPDMARCGRPIRYAKAAVALALPLAVWKSWAVGPAAKMENERSDGFRIASPYSQPETAITRILEQEIGLIPDQAFRGRVAVMVGNILPEERMWQRYSLVHYFAQLATGNLHDGPGLWQDSVPTLMEYNELVSPAHFVFQRKFLSYPGDIQYRNIIGTRLIDLRTLKALGVRLVITDLPISDATLRAQIPIPVTAEARRLLGFADCDLQGFDLFLHELEGANMGQFSPRQTKLARSADEALTYLSDKSLDLRHTSVVLEPVPDRLNPAELETFAVGRDQPPCQQCGNFDFDSTSRVQPLSHANGSLRRQTSALSRQPAVDRRIVLPPDRRADFVSHRAVPQLSLSTRRFGRQQPHGDPQRLPEPAPSWADWACADGSHDKNWQMPGGVPRSLLSRRGVPGGNVGARHGPLTPGVALGMQQRMNTAQEARA